MKGGHYIRRNTRCYKDRLVVFLRSGFVVAISAAIVLATGACERRRSVPPNIVLVTLDTTRPDHLGCYGYDRDTSPNLDSFAGNAVLYEQAYATSSWTLPSHASLFTGLLPMQHGAQSVPEGPNKSLGYGVRPLQESFSTLAELLAAAGYRTGAVIAGPALRGELGVGQGFEVYDDEFKSAGEKFNGRRAQKVADRAIEIVESFGDGPYFLFVNFFDPHAPYRPPPPFDEGLRHPDKKDGKPVTIEVVKQLVGHLSAGDAAIGTDQLDSVTRGELERQLEGYDAEIAYMDHHLGRLLDAVLPTTDDRRPAFVAITADHGESFGEHFFVSHGAHLYDHNVRVPLVVRAPGGSGATRVEAPVQNHRLFATILDAAGVELPRGGQVGSLSDVDPSASPPVILEVHRSDANIRIFGEFFDRDLRAIRDADSKLIESSTDTEELYDLAGDPLELVNRATAEPAVVERLSKELAAVVSARPAQFEADTRAELRDETAEALKALGYLD